jgi:energy-converting hydrogenase Eha subunit E
VAVSRDKTVTENCKTITGICTLYFIDTSQHLSFDFLYVTFFFVLRLEICPFLWNARSCKVLLNVEIRTVKVSNVFLKYGTRLAYEFRNQIVIHHHINIHVWCAP